MLRILEKSVRFSLDLEDEGQGTREEGNATREEGRDALKMRHRKRTKPSTNRIKARHSELENIRSRLVSESIKNMFRVSLRIDAEINSA